MLYKEDWEKATERWEAFWQKEVIDRPVICVTAPREKPMPHKPVKAPSSIEQQWLDIPFRIEKAEAEFACTFYGGEAFPNFWCNLGPGYMATFIGAIPRFAETTVWFETPMDWGKVMECLQYGEGNKWWQFVKSLTEEAAKYFKGKAFVGMTDLGGVTDILASLRGTLNLLEDFVTEPMKVRRASQRIVHLWFRYYSELDELLQKHMHGRSAWMGLWSGGTWYPIQCDFSYMVSPRQFEELILPFLEEQCRWLEHSVYHWDGVGQLVHLDLLLSIPELDAIQWTPGAGKPPVDDPIWFPYYKRIQAAGKGVVLIGVAPQNVERVLSELSPNGLMLTVHCSSEQEAKELLKLAGKVCAASKRA
ncbi:MAG: hypothetical protein RMK18_02870 [Armatimonadota bacterium]|nr:hypothetical protein [Armatimonadota bacterium]MCX7776963.1 hypothetical protein [Armatimonadota bacterium]MDW8024797.1 hypothetical protein [Armatimonadota bacterium]